MSVVIRPFVVMLKNAPAGSSNCVWLDFRGTALQHNHGGHREGACGNTSVFTWGQVQTDVVGAELAKS